MGYIRTHHCKDLRVLLGFSLNLLAKSDQKLSELPEWLRWSRGSVLAFGTQVRGFKSGRSRRIFQGEKILITPSFGREVKPFVPCRRFTACKRSLNVTWKSGIFRQNSSAISRPCISSFHYLAVQVGTTKEQGLYNKP